MKYKRLQSLSGNGTSASYTYNEEGVRTSKTVNGVATSYDYNGSLLMAQTTGSGTGQIKQLYSYDASSQLVSVNYNSTEYFYLRNGQNDIVGLMDGNGTKVVRYAYDRWGKLVSTTGTLATTIGANNPFRYRGYYYDAETGLYYLQTRYYDPEVCRFISADVYMSTGQRITGNNMFAYCGNNPISRYDDYGELWKEIGEILTITGLVVGIIALTVATGGVGTVAVAGVGITLVTGGSVAAITVAGCAGITATTGLAIYANSDKLDNITYSKSKTKTDPDPYARPNQKKQRRENKEKKRKDDTWNNRSGKRRPSPPKKHTPGREHRKY